MELIVLGSGSAFPDKKADGAVRNPSGYAVTLDGRIILFDFGFGSLRQMARAGLDVSRVTDVFFTHRHPDHCGDLAALLFALRYDVKPRARKLRVWGPRGFARFWKELSAAWSPWLDARGYALEVAELPSRSQVRGRGWTVAAQSVPHPTPALAYRLLYKGKSLVYSGDTGFSRELAEFAAGCDLFLLECTLSSLQPAEGHLNPPLALAMLGASACTRGLLTHLSARAQGELRSLLRGKKRIGLARDLLRVRV